MVQAILDGRKTQTRRILKSKKLDIFSITPTQEHISVRGYFMDENNEKRFGESFLKYPYGKVGDQLWVREAFMFNGCYYEYRAGRTDADEKRFARKGLWKPSIHMPRKAARIFLEITAIRVERLQDISEKDAIAEGIEGLYFKQGPFGKEWQRPDRALAQYPQACFEHLWESIHGKKSWKANPFVWVVEFKQVKQPLSPSHLIT